MDCAVKSTSEDQTPPTRPSGEIKSHFARIDDPIVNHILSFLPTGKDVANASMVCRRWNVVFNSDPALRLARSVAMANHLGASLMPPDEEDIELKESALAKLEGALVKRPRDCASLTYEVKRNLTDSSHQPDDVCLRLAELSFFKLAIAYKPKGEYAAAWNNVCLPAITAGMISAGKADLCKNWIPGFQEQQDPEAEPTQAQKTARIDRLLANFAYGLRHESVHTPYLTKTLKASPETHILLLRELILFNLETENFEGAKKHLDQVIGLLEVDDSQNLMLYARICLLCASNDSLRPNLETLLDLMTSHFFTKYHQNRKLNPEERDKSKQQLAMLIKVACVLNLPAKAEEITKLAIGTKLFIPFFVRKIFVVELAQSGRTDDALQSRKSLTQIEELELLSLVLLSASFRSTYDVTARLDTAIKTLIDAKLEASSKKKIEIGCNLIKVAHKIKHQPLLDALVLQVKNKIVDIDEEYTRIKTFYLLISTLLHIHRLDEAKKVIKEFKIYTRSIKDGLEGSVLELREATNRRYFTNLLLLQVENQDIPGAIATLKQIREIPEHDELDFIDVNDAALAIATSSL